MRTDWKTNIRPGQMSKIGRTYVCLIEILFVYYMSIIESLEIYI